MSTLGLVVLALVVVLAGVAVVLVQQLVRQHRAAAEAGSPRTVAELVRLRAGQAADAQPATPVPVEAATEEADPVGPAPATVAPTPVSNPAPARPAPGPARAVGAPSGLTPSGDDTPWNRAARMAQGDGAVWSTAPSQESAAPAPGSMAPAPALDEIRDEPAPTASVVDEVAVRRAARARPTPQPVIPPPAHADVVDTRPSPAPAGEVTAPLDGSEPESPATGSPEVGTPEVGEPEPESPVTGSSTAVGATAVGATAVESSAGGSPAVGGPTTKASRDAVAAVEPPGAETGPGPAAGTSAGATAEQAAADRALLRTFGSASARDHDRGEVALTAVAHAAPEPADGAEQPVSFRVVARDGSGVRGAAVTLLDDRGRERTGATAGADGRGELRAPRPGSYVLVSAAAGHQPGAVAITVADGPVTAEVPLARSASVAGDVRGEDGPIAGAKLTLMQDGDVVDTAVSGSEGEYLVADLAAGEYGLSVTAAEWEPVAVLLTVPDGTDLRYDVEMDPLGLPAEQDTDDLMIGQG